MNAILAKQLAFDFCCTEDDVRSGKNIFTEFTADKNRRIFEDTEDCFLKALLLRGAGRNITALTANGLWRWKISVSLTAR